MAHPAQSEAAFEATAEARPTVTAHPSAQAATRPPAPLPQDPREAALVELLRELAVESRLARKLDLDRACALIAGEPGDAVRRYGLALLAALADGARIRLAFHTAGSAERSFAERWLAGLVGSFLRGDEDSVRFAVDRLVSPCHRRSVRFLARGFAGAWGELEAA